MKVFYYINQLQLVRRTALSYDLLYFCLPAGCFTEVCVIVILQYIYIYMQFMLKKYCDKLHLPRQKRTINEILIFFKITPLAFNTVILVGFSGLLKYLSDFSQYNVNKRVLKKVLDTTMTKQVKNLKYQNYVLLKSLIKVSVVRQNIWLSV